MIDIKKSFLSVRKIGKIDIIEEKKMKTSVSSLPFENIIENLKMIENSGTDFLHLDVMNSTMTKDSTFDYKTIEKINSKTTLFLDCHLMITNPNVQDYINSGVNLLTVHYEAFENKEELKNCLRIIRKSKTLVGLSILTDTNIEEIEDLKNLFDVLLIMSVKIGAYGQKFIEKTFDKINLAREKFPDKLIEVDGGVNLENIDKLKQLGVDIVVLGGSFYKNENKKEFISHIKK